MGRGFKVVDEEHRKNPYSFIELPQRGTRSSAGYDIKCPIETVIRPGETLKIYTDIKAYMEQDEYLDINIRSSVGIKKSLRIVLSVGIIDADYFSNPDNDGNIIIPLLNEGPNPVIIKEGERIAQGIFKKYLLADNDSPLSEQRMGGVGSTKEL